MAKGTRCAAARCQPLPGLGGSVVQTDSGQGCFASSLGV